MVGIKIICKPCLTTKFYLVKHGTKPMPILCSHQSLKIICFSWELKAPIHLTSTKVNDKLVDGIETTNIDKIKTLLFLARVEKAKGIFTAIDAFEIVSKKYPYLKLKVVGRGNALARSKRICK
jgi:glycosyltransferase involved in cell wall biosynthesis